MYSTHKLKYPIAEHNQLFNSMPYKEIYIQNTWLCLPNRLIKLLKDFIGYKRFYGSEIEKEFYENLDLAKLIRRLYQNRALTFTGSADSYTLRDGTRGVGHWEYIGTDYEKHPLVLRDYLSYDEIDLSAFITLSCFTPFINNGSRSNGGRIVNERQPNGVYMGQVGARFQKHRLMDWRYMIIEPRQNTVENGYGPDNTNPKGQYLSLWANFFGVDYFPTYEEAKEQKDKYAVVSDICYFNKEVYKQRIKINAEVFLKEANARAHKIQKHAFCHVVGLGLGVWAILKRLQQEITVEAYLEVLQEQNFKNISDLYFAWFDSIENLPSEVQNIRIHTGKREPAEPLEDPNKLLVANWAWDANSFVGNEYWDGMLSTSGDPAAASCSFVAYFGNPYLCQLGEVHTW